MQSTSTELKSQPRTFVVRGFLFSFWFALILSGTIADVFQALSVLLLFFWCAMMILVTLIMQWKNLKTYFALILLVGFVIAVTVEHLPAKCAFGFAKKSLTNIKKQIDNGETVALPVYAGFYKIVETQKTGSQVGLWVRWPNPSGRTGFVYRETDIYKVNVATSVEMGDGWHLISED